ncbi:hypothetical protein D3C72_2107050 [compost metagenome]
MGGVDGPAPEVDESVAISGAGRAQGGHGHVQGASRVHTSIAAANGGKTPFRGGLRGVVDVVAEACATLRSR